MHPTTAQRFGSLGKSFVSPAVSAAVLGAALLASDTSDTSETAWSPAAACLLPDVLPVAGTLLSYGGNRQLAAGGTVTHSGALNIGANAFTCGAITASAIPSLGVPVLSAKSTVDTISATVEFYSHTNNPIFTLKQNPSTAASGILTNVSQINGLNTISVGSGSAFGSSGEAININSGNMMVGYDGSGTKGYVGTRLAAGLSLYTNNVERLSISSTGAITASGVLSVSDGTAALPAITFTTSPTWGFYKAGASSIGVSIGGTIRQTLWSDGSVLLNGSDPWMQIGSTAGNVVLRRPASNTLGVYQSDGTTIAALTCGAITASGAIQETPTQSALDPTTTNIPSGKRQGWYNSALSEFRDWVNIGGTLLKSAAYTT